MLCRIILQKYIISNGHGQCCIREFTEHSAVPLPELLIWWHSWTHFATTSLRSPCHTMHMPAQIPDTVHHDAVWTPSTFDCNMYASWSIQALEAGYQASAANPHACATFIAVIADKQATGYWHNTDWVNCTEQAAVHCGCLNLMPRISFIAIISEMKANICWCKHVWHLMQQQKAVTTWNADIQLNHG